MTSPAEDLEVVTARPQPSAGGVVPGRRPTGGPGGVVRCFSVLSSDFRTIGNVQNIMDTAAVLAVVTCGITFVLMMGSIDLFAPGVMGASAIAVALLVANNRNDNDLGLLGVLVAILLAAALGCLSGLALVLLKVPSFMTTLGVSAIGLGVATLLFAGVQPNITDPMLESWAVDRFLGFSYLTWIARPASSWAARSSATRDWAGTPSRSVAPRRCSRSRA